MGEKVSISDIISQASPDHKRLIEENMDILMDDLIQQELIHQTFFGSTYMQTALIKAYKKRGIDTKHLEGSH